MPPDRRLAVNRQNSLKSTGPRSTSGKRASSRNALKHGAYSRDALLPDEDPTVFEELHAGVRADLKPTGTVQEFLTARATALMWRMIRLQAFDAAMLGDGPTQLEQAMMANLSPAHDRSEAAGGGLRKHLRTVEKVAKLEALLDRQLRLALKAVRELQSSPPLTSTTAPAISTSAGGGHPGTGQAETLETTDDVLAGGFVPANQRDRRDDGTP